MKLFIKSIIFTMITVLFLLNAQFPALAAKPATDYANIDAYLKRQMKMQAIAGLSYAIVQEDQIVHVKSFGKADLNKKLTPQTPMKLASVSKSFTALAIMQLVEQGRIELEAPVQKYIPWFRLKNKKESSQITIRHLLNQTSGISSNGEIELATQFKNKSLEETVRLLKEVELSHPVGTRFEYTNFNYLCLGLVIEKVTGEKLDQYIEKHILTPLQMNHSYTSIRAAEKNGLSKDFTAWFGQLLPTKTAMSNMPNFLASGYMVSSAEDMGKYLRMYMNAGELDRERIISPQGVKMLQTPSSQAKMYLDGTFFGNYAMGWWSRSVQGIIVLGHSGDLFSTARTDMYILPKQKIGVVILTNTHTGKFAPGDSHIATDGVISLLAGKKPTNDSIQSFAKYYAIFDGIVLVMIGLFIWYFARVFKKWKRIQLTKWVVISMIAEIGIPLGLYLTLPLLLNIPSWSFLFCVQADLVSVVLTGLLLIFIMGLCKIMRVAMVIVQNKISQPTENDF